MILPESSVDERKRIAIRLTKWDDRWHWTIFDADPDYESGRVEGVTVPWDSAEWHDERSITSGQALRRALIAAGQKFLGRRVEVVVPLPEAVAMALGEAARRD